MNSVENILLNLNGVKVIAPEVSYSSYVALDLSIHNSALSALNLIATSDFEKYINDYLQDNQAQIAYGGYNETRNLYKRSTVFNALDQEERNIHIGLDLWAVAGTPILAALDGKIHSFQNNNQWGDYGPTIILEHKIENQRFYTLYGHLSLESIQDLIKGQSVKKGEPIGALGKADVNGDYAPHLHFQIIKDMQNKEGDYPGVCSSNTLSFYLFNCPDPNLLLKINS